MVMGKARIPSDLVCVILPKPQLKTIEHLRTSPSFINASFNEIGTGKISPIEIDAGKLTSKFAMQQRSHRMVSNHKS